MDQRKRKKVARTLLDAASALSGNEKTRIFALPHSLDEAGVIVVPVPFEATVSYRPGTVRGPRAIVEASHQIDVFDADTGRPYEQGIAVEIAPDWLAGLATSARMAAEAAVAAQNSGRAPDKADIAAVDAAGDRLNEHVHLRVSSLLKAGKLPVVIGGDHSVPFGSIVACAAHVEGRPLGILHLDAHCDLRNAYEGFKWSHASIMKNVLDHIENVRLVQVGIRDLSEEEFNVVQSDERVSTCLDAQLRKSRLTGTFIQHAQQIVSALPDDVYLSFDIDGLDPSFCPSTGTPVPGGLSFDEVVVLLEAVVAAGKRIIGMDLVEVAPPEDVKDEDLNACWDANVAARLLYKMIGFAVASRSA